MTIWKWLVIAGRFGRGRSDAEKFLAALQDVYCLERVRVLGDDIRLLKCYPGDWQVGSTPDVSFPHMAKLHLMAKPYLMCLTLWISHVVCCHRDVQHVVW